MSQQIVIVGAGMATAYLLQALARHQHDLRITVIGDEPEVCYNRVMLSAVLAGESVAQDLQMLDTQGDAGAVNFVTGTRVDSVQLDEKTVCTDKGETLSYDRLVIATGASVHKPDLENARASGVQELRTLRDAQHLRNIASHGATAVVVGGGLLGLEAADGLNQLGFSTSVLHRRPWLMNRQLNREGGELLQRKLEKKGISFRLEKSVSRLVLQREKLVALELNNAEQIACDLVVFATGINPNKCLAAASGLETDRGVLVDSYMHTSKQHCYALGECTQLAQQCFGLVAPVRAQAEVLALQLLDIDGPAFELEDWPTQLKISGVDMFSAGQLQQPGEELVLRDHGAGIYRRLLLRQGRLVSAVLVGDKRDASWYQELIHSAQDVSGFRNQLMFGRTTCEAMHTAAAAA